jgi:hypothetical protein
MLAGMAEDYNAGDDKFAALHVEYLPEQLRWKLYRAKQHFMEFEREAAAYMNVQPSGPGRMIFAPDSTPEAPKFVYAPENSVPARFGLIAGDYLQNLRSVFDYLVWQLILANGKTPHETNTSFPVTKSPKAFNEAIGRRLDGVPEEAIRLIETLQPYPERDPGNRPQMMYILDELNNANKHRQVLSTRLAFALNPPAVVPFPHIEVEVVRHRGGHAIPGESLVAYLAFEASFIKGLEVTPTLSALMDWVGFDVLPLFRGFF